MNPYQQNINIVKGYFKKPIVLVFSILCFASILVTMVTNFFISTSTLTNQITQEFFGKFYESFEKAATEEGSALPSLQSIMDTTPRTTFSIHIDLLAVLLAITFLLFFIQSQSEANGRTLKASRVMFRVYAIFQFVAGIVLCSIALPALLLSAALINPYVPEISGFTLLLIPLIIIILLYGISIHVFAKSIKKSLTTIYLTRRGSSFFGVMSLILAVSSLGEIILTLIYFDKIGISFGTISLVMMIVNAVFKIALYVVFALVAFGYSSYIKDYAQEYVVEAYEYEEISHNEYQDGYDAVYAQNPAQNAPQQDVARFCGKCGRPINPDDYFCNNCGTPIQK